MHTLGPVTFQVFEASPFLAHSAAIRPSKRQCRHPLHQGEFAAIGIRAAANSVVNIRRTLHRRDRLKVQRWHIVLSSQKRNKWAPPKNRQKVRRSTPPGEEGVQ